MKRIVPASLAALMLLAATSALALNLKRPVSGDLPHPFTMMAPHHVNAYIGCDDGNPASAYFQGTDDRVGNLFNFGGGSMLTQVQFMHYGWGVLAGPYDYNLELWDPNTCTLISGKNGLKAADAIDGLKVETLDLCSDNLFASGIVVVMIDPNSCAAPNDCYPDVMFDDQSNVFCPVIINNASTSPACFDVSSISGPFLLQVQLNNCTTGTKTVSWGHLKTIYR